MTYKANLQIVVTMNDLYLFNLRKQGQVRFKMNIFLNQNSETKNIKQKQNKNNEPQKDFHKPYCNPYNIARKCDIKQRKVQQCVQNNFHNSYNKNNTNIRNNNVPQYANNSHQNIQNGFVGPKQQNLFKHSTIYKQPCQTQFKNTYPQSQSLIDFEGQSYYSKIFNTKFAQQTHKIQESIFFKCYIPVDNMANTSLIIKVQLLFSPEQQNMFKVLGSFRGKIRKLSPISSYLPISFDQFQGFTINATYHTTIMEFKFQQTQQNDNSLQNKTYEQFSTFQQYLSTATSNFRRAQTKNFYYYYREYLQKELFQVQQRHSDLIRLLNLSNIIQYRFIKVTPNSQILSILNGLPIFNTDRPIDKQIQWILIQQFLKDFLQLKALIYQKWNSFVIFMTQYINQATLYYKKIYDKNLKERFKGNVFSHKIQNSHDWTFSKYQDSGKKYQQMAQNDKKKKKQQQLWSEIFPIQDQNCFEDQKTFIKIFQQIYPVKRQKKHLHTVKKFNLGKLNRNQEDINAHNIYYTKQKYQNQQNYFQKKENSEKPSLSNIRKSSMVTLGQNQFIQFKQKQPIQLGNAYRSSQNHQEKFENPLTIGPSRKPYGIQNNINSSKQSQQKQHIIVLVHGYQASRQDFQVLKLCLQIRFRAKVFISSANQGRTDDNVEAMGKRLAIQLTRYFQNIQFSVHTKISFIGHSLGGVIIRSALGFLNNINQYLHTYMSFSSPHLGYLYEPSRLIKAGLWLMNSWQGSKCLSEICMKDSQDLRTTYFFRLTQNKALNSFKKIAFISSSQDGYIPYQSARIQKNSDILYNKLGDSISRNVILQMVDNLLGDISAEQISRINVIFHIQDKSMDSLIGRTAHIKYLSDLKFIKMFFIVFQKFFN